MTDLPPTIKELALFAETYNHGRFFMPDLAVWERYFEPSFSRTYRGRQRGRGTTNAAGYRFDFEIALTENKVLPNAVCAYNNNCHYILVYHTLPMYLFEFFNRMMCSRGFMEDVGDSQHEISCAEKGFHSPPGFAIHCGEVNVTHMDQIADKFGPRCPRRREVAFELFQYAMEFVLEHEMTHAVNGHIHYLEEENGLKDIREMASKDSPQSSVRSEVIALFEGQADKGSYTSVIARPLLNRMHTPYQVMSTGDTHLVAEVKNKILGGALLGMFWMLTDFLFSGGDVTAYETWGEHPSSLARALGFALMPSAQAELLPPEVGFFIWQGSKLACTELLKQSDSSDLFRPFGWLRKDEMYSTVFEPNELPADEQQLVVSRLEKYRYRP
jgi:hypothetical protein